MIRPILCSLPISGDVQPASSAGTETCRLTPFTYQFAGSVLAAFTAALPPADRQAFYGSFTRDLCDKYLVLFADFKYVRSFFDPSLAAVPFSPDPFKTPGTNIGLSPFGGTSVPIQNPFNPFTV